MTHCVLDQFVKEVTDFSSQYGSDGSISYVANNVVGKPSLYPEYGDFSAAYCLRSYGRWWSQCQSALQPFHDPSPLLPPTLDFLDVKYECAVHPIRVDIYETYHPGSVVRVWGSLEGKEWHLLWAGEPQRGLRQAARIFSPPITQPHKLVNMLRLEFAQDSQEYYSALDAVLLVGSTHTASHSLVTLGHSITSHILRLGLHTPMSEEDILAGVQFLLSEENLQKLLEEESVCREELVREEKADLGALQEDQGAESKVAVHTQGSTTTLQDRQQQEAGGTLGGYFDLLPEELVVHILRHLDLRSLCRLACTCKLLHSYASDPFLYMQLNLKNYWWLVNNGSLQCLAQRCSQLQCLDLSWCGPYDSLDTETFMEFVHTCGWQLRVLRLNNCHFIDNYCLYMIANVCLNLQELSMANCVRVDHLGFGELKKARALTRLDLSRTRIDLHALQLLLQHTTHLRHLNLNNCTQLDLDEVALTLATFTLGLVSLGAWKTHGLTSRGLRALATIPTLTDLDLGWAMCGVSTEGVGELVRGCRGLERLVLAALRTLTDHDLFLLAAHLPHLAQLDIMGTRNVTPDAVHRLLQHCPRLRLLDVSFCEQIHSSHVQQWSLQFPHVSIKGGLWQLVRCL